MRSTAIQPDLFDCGRVAHQAPRPQEDRHELFASALVKHLGNRTRAAKDAGYSARTAYSQGSRLMRNPEVCRMVARKAKKAVEDLDLSAERTLKEIGRIAMFDVRTIYQKNGSLKPIHKLSDQAAAAIAGLEIVEMTGDGGQVIGRVKKVKLADKVAALDKLMRYHGMFDADNKLALSGEVKVLADLTDAELDARLETHGVKLGAGSESGGGAGAKDRTAAAAG